MSYNTTYNHDEQVIQYIYCAFSAELPTPISSNSSAGLLISPLLKEEVEAVEGVVERVASLRGIQPRLTNTIALRQHVKKVRTMRLET